MVAICPRCGKEIEPVRKVGWGWFALWLLLGILPVLIYVFYHFTKVPKTCLFCGYRDVYDRGKHLDKDKIKQLKKRLMDLDYELEHHILTKTEKEKFTREIHEVAEELRKYGFKGTVKGRNPFSKERKY